MPKIKNNLNILDEKDLYSLSLFTLYKLIGKNEYSSLSELAYVLDKESLLNLCEYFGGQTITIPTIDDIENLTYALLLYQYVKIENMEFSEAVAKLGNNVKDIRFVKNCYRKLVEVLDNYTFNHREGNDG